MKLLLGVLIGAVSLLVVSCGNNDSFTSTATTEFFTQGFNPATLDILWVMDSRSPMFDSKATTQKYVSTFFQRLDAQVRDYRMAVTTPDMEFSRGSLRSFNTGVTVLQRNIGTIEERVGNLIGLIDNLVNLRTSAFDNGFAASLESLNRFFVPRANVPLVLIYVSHTDDASTLPAGQTDAVEYYKNQLLALKGGNKDLVRIYAINYFPLPAGADAATIKKFRCLKENDNAIDKPGYQDRYFKLAEAFNGDKGNICATDLDAGFATQVNLTGLRLSELPARFTLGKRARLGSFTVRIALDGESFEIPWTFDETTNELVFAVAPPEGTTIQVTYVSN